MKNNLEIIPFQGKQLFCPVIDGEPYVIVNAIIFYIGLNYDSAIVNLKNHDRLGKRLAEIQIKKSKKGKNQHAIWHVSLTKNGQNDEILVENHAHWEYLREQFKGYKYTLLPVRKIAAWLYSIQLKRVNPAVRKKLEDYQEECDDVLFEYFFGSLTQRKKTLFEKQEKQKRMEAIAEKLRQENEEFREYENLKADTMRDGKKLKQLDAVQLKLNF